MSDQDVFAENQTNPAGDPSVSPTDPFADKLKEIRDETGKPKYKDVDTALEALNASQQFIEQLKQEKRQVEAEKATAEAELAKLGNIDDFVKRLNPTQEQPNVTPTSDAPGGLSEDKVVELMEQRLKAQQEKAVAEQNLQKVLSTLVQEHGDNAATFIQNKAQELGTTPTKLKELSSSNPTMALHLLGGAAVKPKVTPSVSSVLSPTNDSGELTRPVVEKGQGVARGGRTNKELLEMFRQSKEYTNKRIGLET